MFVDCCFEILLSAWRGEAGRCRGLGRGAQRRRPIRPPCRSAPRPDSAKVRSGHRLLGPCLRPSPLHRTGEEAGGGRRCPRGPSAGHGAAGLLSVSLCKINTLFWFVPSFASSPVRTIPQPRPQVTECPQRHPGLCRPARWRGALRAGDLRGRRAPGSPGCWTGSWVGPAGRPRSRCFLLGEASAPSLPSAPTLAVALWDPEGPAASCVTFGAWIHVSGTGRESERALLPSGRRPASPESGRTQVGGEAPELGVGREAPRSSFPLSTPAPCSRLQGNREHNLLV